MNFGKIFRHSTLWLIVLLMATPFGIFAADSGGGKPFRQAQLDQMLAPVALYPDSLLAEVLMASTFPVQVVKADRWVKKNSKLKGDALNAALEKMDWDSSVKALVPFPRVLSMMSEQLEWTQNLGNAFIVQQADVMQTVQSLRAKAHAQNTLKSTKEQKVLVKENVIVIEPVNPQVVYVPAYNPVVVYGAWPYPAYPPYSYYPTGAVVAAGAVGFAAGVAVGAAWNNGWGHWNWGNGTLNVNVNRNININSNNLKAANIHTENWQHNTARRTGVANRNQANRQAYSQKNARALSGAQGSRGRGQTPGQKGYRPGNYKNQARQAPSNMGRQGGGAYGRNGRTGSMGRSQTRPAAFQGLGHGNEVRRDSSRGRMSREAMRTGGMQGGGFGGRGGMRGGFRRR